MRKRHINEFMKSNFANCGRAAGMGVVYDRYDEESNAETYVNHMYKHLFKEREDERDYPVVTKYIYDYADLGGEVLTPQGIGRYLRRKNGKVLVVMDWDCPPVEYDGDEVYIKEGQAHD
jgi:hypothetical protein